MAATINKELKAMLATYQLTRSQLSGLTGKLVIPKVECLYSTILRGITGEIRRLDQSTFGPSADPCDNLCKTPMCIAGHTVNCAGQAGYTLADKVGFATAASLIHAASRPDVSRPRYYSYPNDWALAYIEARAAEEKAVTA